ncbi:MAG: SpoIIE family protein phosphatase [Bryobacteraceae bacterium]|nr:SpoIIE family protein phosphatase [Bryobacteraceae bacterium]
MTRRFGWWEALLAFGCLWIAAADLRWWSEYTRRLWDPAMPMLMSDAVSGPTRVAAPSARFVEAGAQAGDRILAVDGRPVKSVIDYRRGVFRHEVGDQIAVRLQRGSAQPVDVVTTVEARPPMAAEAWLANILVDIVGPAFCLLVGIFVVYHRPRDPVALALFALLMGSAHLTFISDPQYRARLGNWATMVLYGLPAAGIRLMALGSLWFGLLFPDGRPPRRWLPWIGGLISAPLLTGSIAATMSEVERTHGFGWPTAWTRPILGYLPVLAWMIIVAAISVGGVSLFLKHGRDPRRVRFVAVGLLAALAPVVLLYSSTWALQRNAVDLVGTGGEQMVRFMLMAIAPFTMAYAVLVDRTIDIGVALRQGLQYALAARGVAVMRLLLFGLSVWLASSAGASLSGWQRFGAVVGYLGVMAVGERSATGLRGWLDRRFFREAVDAERLLQGLSEEVQHLTDPVRLIEKVKSRIREALHVDDVAVSLDPAPRARGELVLPLTSGGRELGVLALGAKRSEEPYSRSDVQLLEAVARQTGLALENGRLAESLADEAARRERAARELEIAREVQQRLFPQKPPAVDGLTIEGLCVPAQTIGGDYFDYFAMPNGDVVLAIGDVAGKGIPAALLMASVQSAVRAFCADGVTDLAALMTKLNRVIYDASPANRFVTFWIGIYEPPSRRLRYSSGGHNPALLVRGGGTIEWLRTRGVGLGLSRGARFEESVVVLGPGDRLLLYTDGVTEALNDAGEEFGEERLVEEFQRRESASGLVEECLRFAGRAPQHDDLTVIRVAVSY